MTSRIAGPLYRECHGERGPTIVFLHPLPCDRSAWLFQQAHLSTWFRTIAIDLPGYGRSPSARAGLTVAEMADACWEVIDAEGRDSAVLVGLSIGSTIAQFMAASRPDRTQALILTAGGWFPREDVRFRTNIARAIERFERDGLDARATELRRNYGPEFLDTPLAAYLTALWIERNASADLATIIETYRALQTPVPEDVHGRISAPALVITGSADPGTAAHRVLAHRISGSDLRVMEGAGHLCNAERPWEYDALLLGFLRARAPDLLR